MFSLINTPMLNVSQQKRLKTSHEPAPITQLVGNEPEAGQVKPSGANNGDFVVNISRETRSRETPKNTPAPSSEGKELLGAAEKSLMDVYYRLLVGKDLATRASKTKNVKKQQVIQNQLNKLNAQINNIGASAKYKNINLFCNASTATGDDRDIVKALKTSWLESAETVIRERYGLTGDNANMGVVLDEGHEPYLAAVMFNYDPQGKAIDQTMHIAVESALPANLPNGGEGPYYDDRTITHEMVHAIMGRSMNFASMPIWFQEGAAEFIHGADDRVVGDMAYLGGGMKAANKLQDDLGDGTDKSWVSNSEHYSAGFMAVRYLHQKIKESGHSGGIKDLFAEMKNNPTITFDEALTRVSPYKHGVKSFMRDYEHRDHGAKFIHDRDVKGEFTNVMRGGDTGGIGGANVDNGPVRTASSVIPDINHATDTPLKNYKLSWPTFKQNALRNIQLNAVNGKPVYYNITKLDTEVLGTKDVNVQKAAGDAIASYDNAITYVMKKLSQVGKAKRDLRSASSPPATPPATSPAPTHIPDATHAKKAAAIVATRLPQVNLSALSSVQPSRVLQLL